MRERTTELFVGIFMLLGIVALVYLGLRVSGLTMHTEVNTYKLNAGFTNVGDLRPRAAVRIAGVKIGQVSKIHLDTTTFKAIVEMDIDGRENKIPKDTSAVILTQGLLGANYVSFEPGFDEEYLANNGEIEITHPALILENLIGQFFFSLKDKKDDSE